MHKKVQKHAKQTEEAKQNSRKRHKQNWLKKVGVDSQFEGLEGSGLNNGFGQVIPESGSVWVKR